MKTYLYSIAALFLMSINMHGQSPNWSVNENNFQYTMTFVSFLSVDGVTLSSPNDKIAAFVGSECRGVTNLMYVQGKDKYYAYLTVFSNKNDETISFKIYDSKTNSVKDIVKTKNFVINENYGNLFQAYSFASPALSSAAEISSFGFKNVTTNDIVFQGAAITIYLDEAQAITALNSVFQLSPGANLHIGTTKQISGANSMDFTNQKQFQVLSEDQSTLKQWTVMVKKGSRNLSYYKKDAVCSEGGAIKVLSPNENSEVSLIAGNVTLAKQIITNGQTIFNNLSIGTYTVKVEGNVKDININLKE